MKESPARSVRIAFAVLFASAIILTGFVVWPFRAPLFLALVLASVLQGLYRWVARRMRERRATAAGLMTAGMLVAIVGPLAAIAGFVAGQIVKGLAFIQNGALSPDGEKLVNRALGLLHLSRGQIRELATYAAASAEHATQQALAGSSTVAFHAAIMLIAFYFFLLEGPRILRWLERISPLQPRQTNDLVTEFRNVSRSSILGAALTGMFQGATATVGFLAAGVPHAVFFGLLTLVTSFIPVVGTLIIWLPAVALLWMFDHHAASIFLSVWCLVFVVAAEHIGKPFLLRALRHGGKSMHTGWVFLSLLGGIRMFGPIGLVLGPLVIAFFLAMVRIYERDFAVTEP